MTKIKRSFDVFVACTGIMVVSPLFAVAAIGVLLEDGPPVFFRQERVGRQETAFRIWKFRTMRKNSEQSGQLTLRADPRVTRVGRWLRRTKIDELPQLINVIAGDMSLVGPRPEVPRFVSLYNDEQRRVLELTPGITDPASMAFIDESHLLVASEDPESYYIHEIMPAKVRLNVEYAAQATLRTDVLLVLKTVYRLFRGGNNMCSTRHVA